MTWSHEKIELWMPTQFNGVLTWLDVGRPLDVDVEDAVVGLVVALRLEWRLPHQELVAEHAQRPQVDLLIVNITYIFIY